MLVIVMAISTLFSCQLFKKDDTDIDNGDGTHDTEGDDKNPEDNPDNGAIPDLNPDVLNVKSDSLYVKKVENLPEGFIMGMDASAVPSLEASGVKYYDYDGSEKDVYEILSANGINYIRVRVWNDPFDKDGNGYGGGYCDLNNAIEIG